MELRDIKEHLHDELIENGRVDLRGFAADNGLGLRSVLRAARDLAMYGDHRFDIGGIILGRRAERDSAVWEALACA